MGRYFISGAVVSFQFQSIWEKKHNLFGVLSSNIFYLVFIILRILGRFHILQNGYSKTRPLFITLQKEICLCFDSLKLMNKKLETFSPLLLLVDNPYLLNDIRKPLLRIYLVCVLYVYVFISCKMFAIVK